MPQLKDDIGIFKISPVTKLNPDNLQFDYKGKKVSFPELDYAIGMMESSGGTNIKPRYEPKYHQQMVQSYKEKKWIPTSAEQKVIGKYGFINATRLFSTSRGKYQIIPETAYRYTSFAGEPKDLDKPEINEKVFKELMQRNYKLSNGDLKKSIYYWNQGSEYFPKLKNYLNEYRSKNKLDLLSSLNPFSVKNAFAEEPDSGKIPPTQSSFVKKSLSLKDDIGILGSINKGIKFLLSPSNRITTKAIPDYEYEKLESWQKEKAQEVSAPSISIGKQKQAKKWYNVPAKMSNLENIAQTGVDLASIGLFAKLGVDELKNIIQNPSVQSKLYQLQQSGRNLLWRGQKLTGMKPPSALVPVTEDISQIEQAVSSGRISLKDAIRVSPVFKAKQIAIRQPGTPEALAREQMVKEQFPSAYEALQPVAGGMVSKELPQIVQKLQTKGITITERLPGIRILQDTSVKDIYGNKITLPAKEEYQEYKLSNNQVLLHDGKNLIVNKNQLKDVENKNLVLGEKKISPEEAQVEEVVKAGTSLQRRKGQIKQELIDAGYNIEPDIGGEIIIVNQQGDEIMPDELETQNPRVFALAEEYSRLQGEFETPALPDDMPKFSQYQLPGGKNYREVLIKAPGGIEIGVPGKELGDYKEWLSQKKFSKGYYEITGGQRLELNAEIEQLKRNQYKSPHWDEPNVLAHIRMNDRITPDGKKVLFIEEIQSDWAKQGRESGFINQKMIEAHQRGDIEYIPEKGMVPYNPLLKNWQELVLKRAIQEAIKGNYDYISWTTGEQQAERYDLSKVVDWIEYNKTKEGIYKLNIKTKTEGVRSIDVFNEEEMARWIPKETAHKIITSGKKHDVLENLDLKIGGEWAKNLYDKQIPNIMKNLTKGEVGSVDLGIKTKKGTGITTQFKKYPIQPVLKITPEIKARVIGQPMAGGLPMKKKESNRLSEGKNLDTEELAELKFEVANTPKTSAERAFSWFHRWIQSQTGRANIITQKQPTQEAIEFYDKPEFKSTKPITVYRAISKGQKESSLKYTSWTTDRDIAENFLEENGKIISKIATPDEIFLVFDKVPKHLRPEVGEDKLGDTEHEVILKPTKKETGAGGKSQKRNIKLEIIKEINKIGDKYMEYLPSNIAEEGGVIPPDIISVPKYMSQVTEYIDSFLDFIGKKISKEDKIRILKLQKMYDEIEVGKFGEKLSETEILSRISPGLQIGKGGIVSKEQYMSVIEKYVDKLRMQGKTDKQISNIISEKFPGNKDAISGILHEYGIILEKQPQQIEEIPKTQPLPGISKKYHIIHQSQPNAKGYRLWQILDNKGINQGEYLTEERAKESMQFLIGLDKEKSLIGSTKISDILGGKVPPTRPPVKTTEGTPSEEPIDPVQKLLQTLKEAKSTRSQQEAIYTKERGARFAKSQAIGKKVAGEKGFYAELGVLKGQFDKVEFEAIRDKLSQPIIDNLFIKVKDSEELTEWEKISARVGLAKLFGEFGGQVPTNSELILLNKVFPPELTKELLNKRPLLTKFYEALGQVLNIPRSIMASFDLSFGFRQGIFMAGRYPNRFFSGFIKQFKYFGSEKSYQALQESIRHHPNFELAQRSRLAITGLGQDLASREEAFMAPWAERIPAIGWFIRASGRAYTGFANKLRFDIFNDLVNKAEKLKLNPKENLDLTSAIAKFVNAGTGRGSLGKLERAAVALNAFFFSPRLMASRLTLLNPVYYIRQDPFVRKEALKSLLTFAGLVTTVLTLLKLKGAKVSTDVRSADFGKARIGNTRIDVMGGFQQYVRAAGQLITGQYVSSITGRTITLGEGYKPLTRLDILIRQIEYKQAPVFSFITDLMKGQDFEGKPVNVPKQIGLRFVPMVISDLFDVIKEEPQTIPYWPLVIFGVGVQTYGGDKKTQELLTILAGVSEKKANITKQAEQTIRELEMLPNKEANESFRNIYKKDRLLADTIKNIYEEKKSGLTDTDRLIKKLPVENGMRAKYIYKSVMELKDNKERNIYIKDLQKKKIITNKVLLQLQYLIKRRNK